MGVQAKLIQFQILFDDFYDAEYTLLKRGRMRKMTSPIAAACRGFTTTQLRLLGASREFFPYA
jgi:hypothetical protein